MALYFVRHGESESNERNLFAGRFDTPLTALGRRQALQAKTLVEAKNLVFDEVHFSPLSRAKDTAQIIVPGSEALRVESEALVERDFGLLSEQNKSLIKKYFGAAEFQNMFHSAAGKPPQGESFLEMYDRIKKYHEEILIPAEKAGKNVVVVAHKYIIEMFALIAAGLTPEQYHDFRVPNCKPCSWEDLQACVRNTSPLMNHIAEEVEARLSSLMILAAVVGVVLRLLTNTVLATGVFSALTLLLLAANSGYSLLRLDTTIFANSFSSLRRTWKSFLLRGVVGLVLLTTAHTALIAGIGTFLLLPSAMTAPTLSLMWGGDYFLSFQTTLMTSVLSPVLLLIGSRFADPSLFSGAQLGTFLIALLVSVVIPGLAAQMYRRRKPIQAGAMSTNWGWVGGAVLIPLAFLASYQFTPSHIELSLMSNESVIGNILMVMGLFVLVRIFGLIATKISANNERANLDRYITHIAPNIFFWFTLLPEKAGFVEIRLLTTLLFFLSIYLEEKRFVRQFPVQAGLNAKEPNAAPIKTTGAFAGLLRE